MSFHLNELHSIEREGGATFATYERLTREAEGAQPGSPAFMAKVAFEQAWTTDHDALIAQCEATAAEPPEPELIEIDPTQSPGTD